MKEINDILGGKLTEFLEINEGIKSALSGLPKEQREMFADTLSNLNKGIREKNVNLLNKEIAKMQKLTKNG